MNASAATDGTASRLGFPGTLGACLGLMAALCYTAVGVFDPESTVFAMGIGSALASVLAFTERRIPCTLAGAAHVVFGYLLRSSLDPLSGWSDFLGWIAGLHLAIGGLLLVGALRLWRTPRATRASPRTFEDIFR